MVNLLDSGTSKAVKVTCASLQDAWNKGSDEVRSTLERLYPDFKFGPQLKVGRLHFITGEQNIPARLYLGKGHSLGYLAERIQRAVDRAANDHIFLTTNYTSVEIRLLGEHEKQIYTHWVHPYLGRKDALA